MKNTNLKKQLFQVSMMLRQYEHASHCEGHEKRHDKSHRVLSLLKLKPEMTQRELEEFFGCLTPSVRNLLKEMAASGAITYQENNEDTSASLISLTEKGEQILQDAATKREAPSKAFDCLTNEEQETLNKLLSTLADSLKKEIGEEVDFPAHFHRGSFRGRFPAECRGQMDEYEFSRHHFKEGGHGYGYHGRKGGFGDKSFF